MSKTLRTVLSAAVLKSLTKTLPEAAAAKFNLDAAEFANFLTDFLKEQLKAGKRASSGGAKKSGATGRVSGYNLFSKNLRVESKGIDFKEAGAKWKVLNAAQKADWNRKAAEQNKRSTTVVAAAPVAQVVAAQVVAPVSESQSSSENKQRKPSETAAAFSLFCKEFFKQNKKDSKNAQQQWAALSDSEKAEWKRKVAVAADSQATVFADSQSQSQSEPVFNFSLPDSQVPAPVKKSAAPKKRAVAASQVVESSLDEVTSDEKDAVAPNVTRDPDSKKFMVKGTNMFVKSRNDKVVVGKMVNGVEKPLDASDVEFCEKNRWKFEN